VPHLATSGWKTTAGVGAWQNGSEQNVSSTHMKLFKL